MLHSDLRVAPVRGPDTQETDASDKEHLIQLLM